MKKLFLMISMVCGLWTIDSQSQQISVSAERLASGTFLVEWTADGQGETVQQLQLSYVGGKKQLTADPGIGFVVQLHPNITELSGSRVITPGVHYGGSWYTIIARICTGPNPWDIVCDQKAITVKK